MSASAVKRQHKDERIRDLVVTLRAAHALGLGPEDLVKMLKAEPETLVLEAVEYVIAEEREKKAGQQ